MQCSLCVLDEGGIIAAAAERKSSIYASTCCIYTYVAANTVVQVYLAMLVKCSSGFAVVYASRYVQTLFYPQQLSPKLACY